MILIDAPHSHASAALAVRMARQGDLDAIMQGSLASSELRDAVLDPQNGLVVNRQASHVLVLDIPSYPKPLLISDALIHFEPDLLTKADIVQNAVDLAHALGNSEPLVAILAAVETVNSSMRSTLDAAALCKMAERGQITGACIDGPLAFDNAISPSAARTKGIWSRVAGHADILIAPGLDAAAMMTKQLQSLAQAEVAGLVLGTRIPVIFSLSNDLTSTDVASCMLALLWTRRDSIARLASTEKLSD
jgi:phosphotransacetylase